MVTENPDIIRYNKAFDEYKQKRQVWETRGFEYEMFVRNDIEGTGTQFTNKQLAEIKKKYNIPLSINIGFAIKEQMLALLTSIDPALDVVPVGETTKDFAYMWREWLYGTFKFNKTRSQIKRSLGHMIDVGHGIMRVRPNRFYKRNSFNCVIECVKWNYCYFDPTSEDPLFQDCEYQFVAIPIGRNKAMKEYGLTLEETQQAETILSDNWNPYANDGDNDATKTIWVLEIYEKVIAMVYITETGERVTTKPEKFVESYEDVFIKYSLKIGNLIKYVEIMPISNYCLVPYIYSHADSPRSIGLTSQVIDIYKAANKAMALTIENAQKGSNVGLYAFEGSILDRDAYEKSSSEPGGVTEIEANPALHNSGMPVQKQVAQLPNAWFTLFHSLLDLAKYISGILDLIQGDSSNAPDTAGGTNALIAQGSQRIKMHARSIDDSMELLCDLIIEYMQAYSPKGNMMSYISQTDAYMKIRTDVEGAIQQAGNGQVGFSKQEGGAHTATLVEDMTNEKVYAIIGSPKVGQFKVHYKASTNMPSTRLMANQIISNAMSRMQGDATALALMKASLKLLDIPEVDKVLKEADLTTQQGQQIQQLQQQLEKIALEGKKWEDKYYKQVEQTELAEIGVDVAKAQSKVDTELAKLKIGVADSNKKYEKAQRERDFR